MLKENSGNLHTVTKKIINKNSIIKDRWLKLSDLLFISFSFIEKYCIMCYTATLNEIYLIYEEHHRKCA